MESVLILKGQSQYDVLRNFADEIGKGFESLGLKVFYADFLTEDYKSAVIEAVINGCKHVISVNCIAFDLEANNISVYNYFDLTFIGILVDNPFYHAERISSNINKKIITCVDGEHLAFVQDYLKDNTPVYFLPHAGFERNKKHIVNVNRKIDVLFAGSYEPVEEIYESWSSYGEEIKGLLLNMAEGLINNEDENIYNIVKRQFGEDVIKSNKIEKSILFCYMFQIDKFQRAYRREECIKTLVENEVEVTVYGHNWDKLNTKNKDYLKINNPVSFSYLNYLASKSKIFLNIVPSFTDGAHERVFTAMLNGAICVTDYSKFLGECFQDYIDIIFYRWNEISHLPNRIKNILKDYDNNTITYKAYEKAVKLHTWKSRAQSLIDIVNEYESKNK